MSRRDPSEELALRRGLARCDELAHIELSFASAGVAQAGMGEAEPPRDQLRERADAGLARAVRRVVVASTVQLLHQAHDVHGALRIVDAEPVAEQILELVRKAQQYVTG